ncbi:hypothetical protein GE061_008502 [Apolygus lucorum]|uniref:ribonuclease H n=1 Tax=Apolygus lucorum TaxID=248454 RepID=A0A8S9WMP2_APOLU|nr:hypothetical protein GE061_008502 [Apolygus lucorum]
MVPIDIKIAEMVDRFWALRAGDPEVAGPWLEIDCNVDPSEWVHPVWAASVLVETDYEPCWSIYTDGSRINDHTGCAFVAYRDGNLINERKFHLADWCSNNQAELLAIAEALSWISEQNIPEDARKVTLWTDSQVSLDCLRNLKIRTQTVEWIRRTVWSLRNGNWRVAIRWVRAHDGTVGNEEADRLAKEAAMDEEAEVSFHLAPLIFVSRMSSDASQREWNREWNLSQKGRHTWNFYPSISARRKSELQISYKMTQALTGHGRNKASLFRFGQAEDPFCGCDGVTEQTWDHLINGCQLFEQERSRLIRKVMLTGELWPPDARMLVGRFLDPFSTFINSMDFELL